MDPHAARPYRIGLAILAACRRLWPDDFAWTSPPYEYEQEKPPIDILTGGPQVRETIDAMTCNSADELLLLSSDADMDWRGTVTNTHEPAHAVPQLAHGSGDVGGELRITDATRHRGVVRGNELVSC